MKASIWRGLMAVGMKIHHFADPKPPSPNFKIIIPSRLSANGGNFKLVFYVPDSYLTSPEEYRFPVVVNFHGGGFTLGTGTDDARWAAAVLNEVDAVLVSVEYRLAPEFPFSVGVEDGTDALLYLASHAEELRIDPHRMALSGFSAGGNFAFTVPLMLRDLQNGVGKRSLQDFPQKHPLSNSGYVNYKSSSTLSLPNPNNNASSLSLPRPTPTRSHLSTNSVVKLTDLEPTALEIDQKIPDLTLRAIVSFYPPTDFRRSRAEKRITNPAPEKNLPPALTKLFDESYMGGDIDMSDPYLSPITASDEALREAYPEEIVLYTCEYDMLNVEGIEFGERLISPNVHKTLHGGLIKKVPHAFDKKPNPLHFPPAADKCYNEACAQLKRVFGGRASIEERTQLDDVELVQRFHEEEAKAGVKRRESIAIQAERSQSIAVEGGMDKGKKKELEEQDALLERLEITEGSPERERDRSKSVSMGKKLEDKFGALI